MRPRGSLLVVGEHATIVFHRTYPHKVEHVWEAISTADGLRAWLMCTHANIEGRVGGTIELASGPSQYRSSGAVLAWDPPRVLEYEWNVAPVPEMPNGEHAIFRYELTPDGDKTHVVVTYSRITARTARGFLPGLHVFLDRLEAQLDDRPLPNWMSRFAEVREQYPEWRQYASAARE